MSVMNLIVIMRVVVGFRLMNVLVRVGRLRLGRGMLVMMVLIVAMLMAVGHSGMLMRSLFHFLLLLQRVGTIPIYCKFFRLIRARAVPRPYGAFFKAIVRRNFP